MDELFSQELLIRHEQAEEEAADPQQTTAPKQKMKNPGLLAAFKDFFANLSPHNQWSFGVVISSVLVALLVLFCLM
jgi:hypothetical protein